MNIAHSLVRLARSEDGGPAADAALMIALVAAVAGFGMLVLGDSLGSFFTGATTGFDINDSFPLGIS